MRLSSETGYDVQRGEFLMTSRVTHPKIVDQVEIDDGRVVVTIVYVVSAKSAGMMVKAEARNELHVGVPLHYYEQRNEKPGRRQRRSKKVKRKARKNRSDTSS